MVEVIPQAQLITGIIALVVFSALIIKIIKNVSALNDDGDLIIDLDKMNGKKGGG